MMKWIDLIMVFDTAVMRRNGKYEYERSYAGEKNQKCLLVSWFECLAITMWKALCLCMRYFPLDDFYGRGLWRKVQVN